MSDGRPSPEHLLERWNLEEGPRERGRLKLFFGAVAGVGKTFAMLQAAHELKGRGVDVVIGWVETHGRKDTESLLRRSGTPARQGPRVPRKRDPRVRP